MATIDDWSIEGILDRLTKCVDEVRQGDYEASRVYVSELRVRQLIDADLRVAIQVMLVEGLLLYFEKLDSSSIDRLKRALVLAEASNLPDLVGLISAWLAHMHFEVGRAVDAVHFVCRVLNSAGAVSDAARMRAHIVAASCRISARQIVEAEPHYRVARVLASALGDRSSVGAIMYNRFALRLNVARLRSALGSVPFDELRDLSGQLSSSVNFDNLVGARALVAASRVLRARLLLLEGRTGLARTLLEAQAEVAREMPTLAARLAINLDLCWCDIQEGEFKRALDALLDCNAEEIAGWDTDDQLVYFALLRRSADGCLRSDLYRIADTRVAILREAYEASIEQLTHALRDLPVPH